MSPPPAHQPWAHWPQQQQHHAYPMMHNHQHFHQQYDSRPVTSAPMVSSAMAPHYVDTMSYGMAAIPAIRPGLQHPTPQHPYPTYEQPPQHHSPPPHHHMTADYRLAPQEARTPLPILSPQHAAWPPHQHQPQYHREAMVHHEPYRRSPAARTPAHLSPPRTPDPMKSKDITYNAPLQAEGGVDFATPIDVMMKAIQQRGDDADIGTPAESKGPEMDDSTAMKGGDLPSPAYTDNSQDPPAKVKKYKCPFNCPKTFSQSTHLETHKRAHTGVKPYLCEWIGCGRSFTQPGNLKTHYRLHTGERPFKCELCDARFPQRGNLRAHMNTHSKSKPFVCKLEECNKCFTTRGNLKNHQNKYHEYTLARLSDLLVSAPDVNSLSPDERDLLQYFAAIYKNSNKGIKGRGRDRRVSGGRMGRSKM